MQRRHRQINLLCLAGQNPAGQPPDTSESATSGAGNGIELSKRPWPSEVLAQQIAAGPQALTISASKRWAFAARSVRRQVLPGSRMAGASLSASVRHFAAGSGEVTIGHFRGRLKCAGELLRRRWSSKQHRQQVGMLCAVHEIKTAPVAATNHTASQPLS